uniref:Uncharacterized protein n=1 Tax=Babesia bovis TaxID=5865 RepID=S6CAA2_BABBO|nr:hypothetical protein [Babesia bovis]
MTNMPTSHFNIRVQTVDAHDTYTQFRAFAGIVESIEVIKNEATNNTWKGKRVIGITENTQVAVNDVITKHPLTRIAILPEETKCNTQNIVSNLIPLTRALICENIYMRTVGNEIVVLIASSLDSVIPYPQRVLIKNNKVIVYLPPSEIELDQHKATEEDYKHKFFSHAVFKPMISKIIVKRLNIDMLYENVLKLTEGIGASAIAILPGVTQAFKTEEVKLNRQVLLSGGMGCRIVWHQQLEQVDPCEAKCLYNKACSLGFFNFDEMLKAHCIDGIVLHALLETVKRAIQNNIYTEI